MDEHEVGIEELCERLGLSENNALPLNWTETGSAKPEWSVDTANIKGLTTNQVLAAREEYGLNQLTPPKKTPEIIIFLTHLFGDFFSLLLWGGSVLCFVAYGVKLERDNVSHVMRGTSKFDCNQCCFSIFSHQILLFHVCRCTLASCLHSW